VSYRPVVATVQSHDLIDLEVAIADLLGQDVQPVDRARARARAAHAQVSLTHVRTVSSAGASDTYTALVIIP
jgi:hypothetical protein